MRWKAWFDIKIKQNKLEQKSERCLLWEKNVFAARGNIIWADEQAKSCSAAGCCFGAMLIRRECACERRVRVSAAAAGAAE